MKFFKNPHIRQSLRSLFKAQYITLGAFLILFVVSHILGALYTSSLSERETKKFHDAISQETTYLKNTGDNIAQNSTLIDTIVGGDRTAVLSLLQAQTASTSIQRLSVADKKGFILGRSANPGKFGDNVFLSTPAGRVVAQGTSTQSIEMTGFGNQMYITTVRPIMKDSSMVGALFANQFVDDAYAGMLRDTFLSPGTQVIFYSKQYGVYSDSFTSARVRDLVTSYFNSGSDWVSRGVSDSIVDFGNGDVYVVKNIVFAGLEQSPGGAILFIPRYDLSRYVNWAIVLLVLIVFLVQALILHIRCPKEVRGFLYYILLGIGSIPILVLSFFALQAYTIGLLHLEKVPYPLYNSTMRLQPDYGIYQVGSEQLLSIIVDTGDEQVNAVGAGIQFDPKRIDIQSVDTRNSDCSYFIENKIDTTKGEVSLNCIILNPKDGQQSLTIGNLVLKTKIPGIFSLSFNKSETQVLANDGLGTNVLRMAEDSSYRADNYDESVLGDAKTSSGTARSFIVFSPSHPNESRWYNSPTASFIWVGKKDAVYRYAFDTSPDTVPSNQHTLSENHIDIPLPGDGIFYFHLQLASGGPIAHYRIQTDMTPPRITSMQMSAQRVVAGEVVRFSFNADDVASGVQKNYYINLGDHLFLPVGSELYVPFLQEGDQTVTLRVYDDAGNYTEKSETVHVSGK